VKQRNRVKRLEGRQAAYDAMLKEAGVLEAARLQSSYKRPGSLKK